MRHIDRIFYNDIDEEIFQYALSIRKGILNYDHSKLYESMKNIEKYECSNKMFTHDIYLAIFDRYLDMLTTYSDENFISELEEIVKTENVQIKLAKDVVDLFNSSETYSVILTMYKIISSNVLKENPDYIVHEYNETHNASKSIDEIIIESKLILIDVIEKMMNLIPYVCTQMFRLEKYEFYE